MQLGFGLLLKEQNCTVRAVRISDVISQCAVSSSKKSLFGESNHDF